MDKVVIVLDKPDCCLECVFRRHSEDMSLGNFTYQRLYRCGLEPEYLNEDNGDVIYLNDFMLNGKAPWCPLRDLPEKKDISSMHHYSTKREALGYNKCIDEILGG